MKQVWWLSSLFQRTKTSRNAALTTSSVRKCLNSWFCTWSEPEIDKEHLIDASRSWRRVLRTPRGVPQVKLSRLAPMLISAFQSTPPLAFRLRRLSRTFQNFDKVVGSRCLNLRISRNDSCKESKAEDAIFIWHTSFIFCEYGLKCEANWHSPIRKNGAKHSPSFSRSRRPSMGFSQFWRVGGLQVFFI